MCNVYPSPRRTAGPSWIRPKKPLERDKAQVLLFVGRKRPSDCLKSGHHRADELVTREARIVLQRSFEVSAFGVASALHDAVSGGKR